MSIACTTPDRRLDAITTLASMVVASLFAVAGCRLPPDLIEPQFHALALDGRGERLFVVGATHVRVLARAGAEQLREVDTLPLPCATRDAVLDLEHFRGELYALCSGGAVLVAGAAGWREVLPAVPVPERGRDPATPHDLQVSHDHLYRVYPGFLAVEPIDAPASSTFVVHPLRRGGDHRGLDASAVVHAAPGVSPGMWLSVEHPTRARAEQQGWWRRRRDYQFLVIDAGGNTSCRVADSLLFDVAGAVDHGRSVFVGLLAHRQRLSLLVFDGAIPATRASDRVRWFDLSTLRPIRARRRVACR